MYFNDIGSLIVFSFLIIVILPPFEFLALWALRWLLRAWDQRKCCCPTYLADKTRKKTIKGYKELYEGPEFDIEYQYATVWILCLMAFTFGPLMPLMFLFSLMGLLILYVTLRLRIAYSIKRVPSYD